MDISLPFLITSKAQSHPLWLIYIYTLQKHANMIIRFFSQRYLNILSYKRDIIMKMDLGNIWLLTNAFCI